LAGCGRDFFRLRAVGRDLLWLGCGRDLLWLGAVGTFPFGGRVPTAWPRKGAHCLAEKGCPLRGWGRVPTAWPRPANCFRLPLPAGVEQKL
jgi:hypothetical protein